MTNKTTTFRQNSTSFINIVSFKSDTFLLMLLLHFDAFLVERFIFGLKINSSFGNDISIGASLPWSILFRSTNRLVVIGSQIWRIKWMEKQFKVQFIKFCHCCDTLMTRSIVLVKDHFFLAHLGSFFRNFFLQTHQ